MSADVSERQALWNLIRMRSRVTATTGQGNTRLSPKRSSPSVSVRNTATLLEVLVATKIVPLSGLDLRSAFFAMAVKKSLCPGIGRGS